MKINSASKQNLPVQNIISPDHASIMEFIGEVEVALSENGFTCHSGSALGSLFAAARRLVRKAPANHEQWKRLFFRVNEALRIALAIKIALGDPGAKEAIHRVTRGNFDAGRLSPGKDAMWELDCYRRLRLGDASVFFGEPDLVMTLNAQVGQYAIACKKIYSEDNFKNIFSEGCEQISKHKMPGVVAVNLDEFVLNYPGGALTQSDHGVLMKTINESFLLRNSRFLTEKMKEKGCDGVLVSTCAVLEMADADPPINIGRFSAVLPCEGKEARFENFLRAWDAVIDRS